MQTLRLLLQNRAELKDIRKVTVSTCHLIEEAWESLSRNGAWLTKTKNREYGIQKPTL